MEARAVSLAQGRRRQRAPVHRVQDLRRDGAVADQHLDLRAALRGAGQVDDQGGLDLHAPAQSVS
ncbi:hypothetical protein P8627_10190 [Jannaschia sp. GRR-S6-38]|uniref:Uncharacterized protein n=1 Tax=Jannaschia ovalis TaxID=3038773 RepID=A0ABY8L9X5_9RHOB|nr:hypothetical protein [Jannaschia sp. GRR-S6-38]WGH77417.1 hypothetical protein P8627_10190 [Jannaschia sp. GRR-S6-38]